MPPLLNLDKWNSKEKLIRNLHILILILCLILITIISLDIFKNPPEATHRLYSKIQFWICNLFIIDFFVEWFLNNKKFRYFYTHILFLIVSIPYLDIIEMSGVHFDPATMYYLRFIPLIRGGYALAIIVSWLSYSWASTLMVTYLTILFSTLYFSSLLFYSVEHGMNPLVLTYSDALWWAWMDVTTVGSNIFPVTTLGKILAVLLASMGMMMFPIGTVYITSRVSKDDQRKKKEFEEMYGEIMTMKNNVDEKEKQLKKMQEENSTKNGAQNSKGTQEKERNETDDRKDPDNASQSSEK